jgi:hypothetical protein
VNITSQFLKYLTVAMLSAGSDWVVFVGLLAASGLPIMRERTLIEARRFLVLFLISYVLSLSLFSALTFIRVSPYWAKLITDTCCFFFNFLMMRLWVYRPPQPVPNATADEDSSFSSERRMHFVELGS